MIPSIVHALTLGKRLQQTPQMPGRLTTENGVPVSSVSRASQGTIYYVPFASNMLPSFNGATLGFRRFTSISLALSLASGAMADVFLNQDGTLSLGTVWRGTGQVVGAASNATPIVVTATSHGLENGDEVYVQGVSGNTAANGAWICLHQGGLHLSTLGGLSIF